VNGLTRATRPSGRKRRLVRLALLAAVSAALLRALCAAAPSVDRARDVTELGREVAALRDELAALRRAAAGSRPREQDRQALEAETREHMRLEAAAAERALQKQEVDVAWSTEARALIVGAAANEDLAATSVDDVECRATLCRVRVIHPDAQAQAAFESEFPAAVAHLLPQLMVAPVEADGDPASSILYLARDGHDLPSS
jgi:hypothetical protein